MEDFYGYFFGKSEKKKKIQYLVVLLDSDVADDMTPVPLCYLSCNNVDTGKEQMDCAFNKHLIPLMRN